MTGDEVDIRVDGRAGRITLNRPKALNALTHDIVRKVAAALADWASDDRVALVILDAAGEKAFCAGGDLMVMYEAGQTGDHAPALTFWRDEYRMNAAIANFPKPVVAFLQGYTMGGGVGLACHGSHRIVGSGSQIAMPETSIGLVPDVGGSLLLARAPGRLGEYLATTARRLGPGDAIRAGFADHFVPETEWPALAGELVETGDADAMTRATLPRPDGVLEAERAEIDRHFAGATLGAIRDSLRAAGGAFAEDALARMQRNAPLAMACALEIVRRNRAAGTTIEQALDREYRYTSRAVAQGDFVEGIRAQIVDKDRAPRWAHPLDGVPAEDVADMLAPVDRSAPALDFGEETA